ncbi:hypothetical protein SEMRO_3_G002110.1 [Seminavis robusta]|uniref:Uncharacterized protein n=1 Tax=Seminavis robusta TaxID=568900 RepID=A0A9N8D6W3_9STRA|nr:hypothetical protein SEMRO_3_G002110.1 [Seminavis robusta]|eukprot:Sro3_g002110.1 n/a (398) ;mRNA; f:53528-54721
MLLPDDHPDCATADTKKQKPTLMPTFQPRDPLGLESLPKLVQEHDDHDRDEVWIAASTSNSLFGKKRRRKRSHSGSNRRGLHRELQRRETAPRRRHFKRTRKKISRKRPVLGAEASMQGHASQIVKDESDEVQTATSTTIVVESNATDYVDNELLLNDSSTTSLENYTTSTNTMFNPVSHASGVADNYFAMFDVLDDGVDLTVSQEEPDYQSSGPMRSTMQTGEPTVRSTYVSTVPPSEQFSSLGTINYSGSTTMIPSASITINPTETSSQEATMDASEEVTQRETARDSSGDSQTPMVAETVPMEIFEAIPTETIVATGLSSNSFQDGSIDSVDESPDSSSMTELLPQDGVPIWTGSSQSASSEDGENLALWEEEPTIGSALETEAHHCSRNTSSI